MSSDLRPATLLKKRLWHRFFVKLRTPFLQNTPGRLLLPLVLRTGRLNSRIKRIQNKYKNDLIKKTEREGHDRKKYFADEEQII